MAPTLFHGWAHIETFEDVWRPRFAAGWLYVNYDFSTRGSKWRSIVIKCSVDLSIGEEVGVDTGWAQEVQS